MASFLISFNFFKLHQGLTPVFDTWVWYQGSISSTPNEHFLCLFIYTDLTIARCKVYCIKFEWKFEWQSRLRFCWWNTECARDRGPYEVKNTRHDGIWWRAMFLCLCLNFLCRLLTFQLGEPKKKKHTKNIVSIFMYMRLTIPGTPGM